MAGVIHFVGMSQDVEDFLEQFDSFCVVKKISEADKRVIFASFLRGPALSFYRAVEKKYRTYEELKAAFQEEFRLELNYAQLFYFASQKEKEDILDFFYRLQELASKAGIVEDATFITQFLKGAKGFYKHKLATTLYKNKKELKLVITQLKNLYESNELKNVSIPICPEALPPTTGDAEGARFYTPEQGRTPPPRHPFTRSASRPTWQQSRIPPPRIQGRGPAASAEPRRPYDLRSSSRTQTQEPGNQTGRH